MRGVIWLVLLFAVSWPFMASRGAIDLATLALIYIMLGLGLNVVVGLAGLLDVPHDVSVQAQARIARMRRRAQAVVRVAGGRVAVPDGYARYGVGTRAWPPRRSMTRAPLRTPETELASSECWRRPGRSGNTVRVGGG